jgi:hypothetical protein
VNHSKPCILFFDKKTAMSAEENRMKAARKEGGVHRVVGGTLGMVLLAESALWEGEKVSDEGKKGEKRRQRTALPLKFLVRYLGAAGS